MTDKCKVYIKVDKNVTKRGQCIHKNITFIPKIGKMSLTFKISDKN